MPKCAIKHNETLSQVGISPHISACKAVELATRRQLAIANPPSIQSRPRQAGNQDAQSYKNGARYAV